jgi:thioredoxin reductase (NADPH)
LPPDAIAVEPVEPTDPAEPAACGQCLAAGSDWLHGVVDCDDHGFVLTGPDLMGSGSPPASWPPGGDPYLLETSVPGVFAAGDVRANPIKRVASGIGEGAMAVAFIHRYRAVG